jgi:hypothetical protein
MRARLVGPHLKRFCVVSQWVRRDVIFLLGDEKASHLTYRRQLADHNIGSARGEPYSTVTRRTRVTLSFANMYGPIIPPIALPNA